MFDRRLILKTVHEYALFAKLKSNSSQINFLIGTSNSLSSNYPVFTVHVHIFKVEVNLYHATVFCPEEVVCSLRLLHIFKCTSG